ncbi:hypothetical protein BH11GEM1_BH11GEM1_13140 [soil metagenome]
MPSRAELRVATEWVLRGALLASLGTALWLSVWSAASSTDARSLVASRLGEQLVGVIADRRVQAVDVKVDVMPTRGDRALLVALRRAGVAVHWHDVPPALAIEAVRVREPDGRTRMLVSAGDSSAIVLSDSAGVLDTVRAHSGATIDATTIVGGVRAQQGAFVARASTSAAEAQLGAVLVLGRADWETKFVMSALSEAGWTVRASVPIAPTVSVRDDGVLPLDTARYDVVVALDSSAAEFGTAIARFVGQGGGLVASGAALGLESIRALAPGSAGNRLPGRILLAGDSVRPRDLPLRPLSLTRTDAITLDRQAAGVALVGRRAGMGRVLAVGYDESWRWRMLGGVSGLSAHRRWWSAAVGSVTPERADVQAAGQDAAPLASLVTALGKPSPAASARSQQRRDVLPLLLLVLLAGCLLAETASRRFRGSP